MADCSTNDTNDSVKVDNLITAGQTGTLLDVDMHSEFRTLREHKASFFLVGREQFGVQHFCTQGRRKFSSSTLCKISVAPTPQEGGDVCGTHHIKERKELSTRKDQDATNIVSAPAESCIQILVSESDFDDTTDVNVEKHSLSASRISLRRSMKQDLSDSTTSFSF